MGNEAMKCPRDGATLEAQKYESNIEVDVCSACHGMWLDKGELEAIEASSEHDYAHELAEDQGVAPQSFADLHEQQRRGPIDCPKCGKTMESREYGYASRIHIDTCIQGCGVWLDRGEIQALEKFFDDNRKNRTLPLRWRLWASVLSVLKR